MKKSLLALAVLGAFAGAATAQSSVTMYGRVDLSLGKPVGVANKGMFNGSGSRLGMRGVEDLGGGLKGLFNIETRFDADTGAAQNFNITPTGTTTANANRFWGARSIVGVEGGFGQITLGREYTTAFLQSQLISDPWGWDTVVAGSGGGSSISTGLTGGGIAKVRNDSALTYKISFAGVTIGAQTAERTDAINSFPKRPVNVAVNYAGGPLAVNFGHEVSGVTNEKWTTVGASFAFGPVKPGLFYGKGRRANNADVTSIMGTVVVGLGAGELRVLFGQREVELGNTSTKDISGLGVGYHHSLSKRTTAYVDFARNGKLAAQKTGYDIGLKHNF